MAAIPTEDWLAELHQHALDLTDGFRRVLDDHSQTLDWMAHRLQSPSMAIDHQKLRLSSLLSRLRHGATTPITGARFRIEQARSRLQHALPDTRMPRARLSAKTAQLQTAFSSRLTRWQHALASASNQLELLAPQRTLERGYAILADESGRVLRQPSEIQPPQRLKLTLAGGSTLVDIAARTSSKD
jgi:exodeoxyribonuclease VII large subunit